ncbi:MAG: citramalate synthase [Opitutales bacterium]|nr:citramalate synthase [Opitutales bacterium]
MRGGFGFDNGNHKGARNTQMKQKVFIYDTTLRDGTQGEGISLTVASKLRLAQKMDDFGVDFIEGGWPGSNPRDMAFFEQVLSLDLKHAIISAFGSTRRANVRAEDDAQLRLLLDAKTPCVTIFGKTWLLHVEQVIKTTAEENLKMIKESVEFLKKNGRMVIYDAEHFFDGFKDNREYALKTLQAAIDGGADYLCLCDTNGGTLVEEFKNIVKDVCEFSKDVPVAVHCHNDSGVGVAVSLAGVQAGATMVQGTLNGFGERNGNANLCTIIPNLALKLGCDLNCAPNLSKLRDLSLFADEMANARSDSRQPYVGASSFAHKGGVHADAANKVKRSYEHISPELVGNKTRVLVSDMSGRALVMMKAKELGMEIDAKDPKIKDFLDELKQLEFNGYGYEAADASFKLLLAKFLKKTKPAFAVHNYRVMVERDQFKEITRSEATVKLEVNGVLEHMVAEAHGPVGALDLAFRKALVRHYPQIMDIDLIDFKVRVLDSGLGANAVVRVQAEFKDGDSSWGTVGASDNVIEAA